MLKTLKKDLHKQIWNIQDELSFEELLEITTLKKDEYYPSSTVDFVIETREKYEKNL